MTIEKPERKPLLISHRGAHREAPENSASGFEIALGYGVDGIETDVQLTRDGIPVLHHNATTSTITGLRKRISAYTAAELKALNLGRNTTREKILFFAETLKRFAGRTALFVEIKSRKHDRLAGRSQALTDKVLAEIMSLEAGIRDNIRILSFDPDLLVQANRTAPQLKCVLNTDGTGAWCVPVSDLVRGKTVLGFLSAVCLETKNLSGQVVTWAHGRGLQVFTYCCNTRPQVERALDLGVDGIMSDKPGWLVGLFN